MDFSLSEDQKALQDLARKMISDLATHDRLKTIEAGTEWFDRKLWDELAKSSLLGVAIPEEYGGGGFGFFELCLLLESIGLSCAPIPAYPTLVLGALPIAHFGSVELKQRYLPGIAEGRTILTAALVDVGSDDPMAPTAKAKRIAGGWQLTGKKMNVPVLHIAEAALVTATTPDGGILVAIVDAHAPQLGVQRQETTSGEPHFIVDLNGVTIPDNAVLATPARGHEVVQWMVDHAMAALCVIEAGVTERALRMTAQYTSTREQFGKPLSKFQAVAQRAADSFIDVEAIRWTAWQAVWMLGRGLPAREEILIAKFWVGEGGHRVVYAAQHLHGGIGVDLDYPLFRSYLWSKQIKLTLGSATQQLAAIGAAMAGPAPRLASASKSATPARHAVGPTKKAATQAKKPSARTGKKTPKVAAKKKLAPAKKPSARKVTKPVAKRSAPKKTPPKKAARSLKKVNRAAKKTVIKKRR